MLDPTRVQAPEHVGSERAPDALPQPRRGAPLKWLGGGGLLIALAVAALVARHKLGPYHFREVEAGILYRSGVLRPRNLERVIRAEGIRTVINLQPEAINELPWHELEARVCRENGAVLVDMPLGPEEPPRPEYVRRFLELINDPTRRPVLVHCQHGVIRTGMLVAVYELEKGGERTQVLDSIPTFGHRLKKPRHDPMWKFLREYQPSDRVDPLPPSAK